MPTTEAEAGADAEVRAGHANFEMKWAGPDGVVIDILAHRLGRCALNQD